MATYLPGVTDTGFNPVSFTPNLPSLMDALQKVTTRYEKNYNEMAQGYSSILNADIINDVKNKERDGYLNKIKDGLKTISTTDLSVQSNIDAANSLYTPFWEDKSMLAHIADSKARKNQLAEQERIKREHPDYDNTTPTTVMNYYINKIKTAENPDIINQTPLINAVGLKNNPKDFQEWLKKNEWKQDFTVAQNGRLYKQVNGNDSLVSYTELFKTYLGNSAQDQYNMYGEYYKIQGIQDIKAKKKENEGIDISDDDAIKLLPTYYVDKQIKNYNLQKEALMTEMSAVNENIAAAGNDLIKLQDYTNRLELLDNNIKKITKEENLLKTKGGTNENDVRDYNDLISSISNNPTSFFANISYNKDVETAAKMAASNQSLSITTDEASFKMAELQQNASQFAQTQQYKYDALAAKIQEDADGNLTSTKSKSKSVDGKTDENGVVWENATPTVTNAQSSNNIIDAVTSFEKIVNGYTQDGVSSIINVLQSSNSTIFSDVITPQDVAVVAKGYQTNDFTAEYKTVFEKAKKSLLNKNVPKSVVDKITEPTGLLLALSDYYTSDIDKKMIQKEANLKNGKPDKQLDQNLLNSYKEYTALQTARTQINNAFAYQKEFDDNINLKIQNDPKHYEKISIVKKDGKLGIVTAQDLSDKYQVDIEKNGKKTRTKIPYGILQQYVKGTLNEKSQELFQKREDDPRGPRISLGFRYTFLDPETNINYDLTNIVKKYGTSKQLADNLNKTVLKDKTLVPSTLQQSIINRTGEMGRTITWTSSTKSETDFADKIGINIGQNLDLYMIQKDDGYNIINANKDLSKILNSDVIPQIKSNPVNGLTAVKYDPIGKVDPSKRNITLSYDKKILLGGDEKTREKYKDWDGSVTFEIKSDAEIPGLPRAASGSFYDLLLSSSSKGMKQTSVDEKFGLKYEFFKDQNNQIQYRAGYKDVVQDPTTKILSYVWKNQDGSAYNETGGFSILPSHVTVEDVINNLRNTMLGVVQKNDEMAQRANPSPAPVSLADQNAIDALKKRIDNVKNQYK
jgi:hypothetical protein